MRSSLNEINTFSNKAPSEATASRQPIRVVYVMGSARSGSTVLDTLLGNHPDVEGVGELVRLPLYGWIENDFCACGQRANTCPFWTRVKDLWTQRTAADSADDYLTRRDDLRLQLATRLGFKQPDRSAANFQIVVEQIRAFYEAVQEISGKPIIVDSSKHAFGAYLLSLIDGIDLRVIHLVRDGRGVAWSLNRGHKNYGQSPKQSDFHGMGIPVYSLAYSWMRNSMRAQWVRRHIPPEKSIRVRYEDLVLRPRETLSTIGALIGVDLSGVIKSVEDKEIIRIGHTIAGNPWRVTGKLQVKFDEEWKRGMKRRDQWLVWAVAGWMMARYGYTGIR